jgi:hypothetical protein
MDILTTRASIEYALRAWFHHLQQLLRTLLQQQLMLLLLLLLRQRRGIVDAREYRGGKHVLLIALCLGIAMDFILQPTTLSQRGTPPYFEKEPPPHPKHTKHEQISAPFALLFTSLAALTPSLHILKPPPKTGVLPKRDCSNKWDVV